MRAGSSWPPRLTRLSELRSGMPLSLSEPKQNCRPYPPDNHPSIFDQFRNASAGICCGRGARGHGFQRLRPTVTDLRTSCPESEGEPDNRICQDHGTWTAGLLHPFVANADQLQRAKYQVYPGQDPMHPEPVSPAFSRPNRESHQTQARTRLPV